MFPSSTKREIRHFHVVVVQRRQRNLQKSVMRVQSCYFANLALLVYCHSRCRRRRRCLSSRLKYLQWSLHSKLLFCQSIPIECFHSRGQHICKFIGTKESVCIRKEFNSQGSVWDTNMAAVSLFWDTNMAAMTSCENTPLGYCRSR